VIALKSTVLKMISVTRIMPRIYPTVRPRVIPTLLWYLSYVTRPAARVVIETSGANHD
jgi:hypothetical protein